MNWLRRSALVAVLVIVGFAATLVTAGASTVTASIALLPGQLTLTEAPSSLTYTTSPRSDDVQTFVSHFTVSVTDATGSRAGWHLQASFGHVTDSVGFVLPVYFATIVNATIVSSTGRPPANTLTYPRPVYSENDTLFITAGGTGAGKSSLMFTTEINVPASATTSGECTAALVVSILSGP